MKSDGCTFFAGPGEPRPGVDLDFSSDRSGLSVGVKAKVDVDGNVYCGRPCAFLAMDSDSNHLGANERGDDTATNVARGDLWATPF
ncbi:MAG: hypothetical protein IIB16_01795 [Chloroflexi bacterium]|nr:hypothetical protein [Chloroflexota bacterium]